MICIFQSAHVASFHADADIYSGPAQQARDAASSSEANLLASATMVQDMYGYNVANAVHKAMRDRYRADTAMLQDQDSYELDPVVEAELKTVPEVHIDLTMLQSQDSYEPDFA